MSQKIQVKRGTKARLPTLAAGELALTTDEKRLYVGTGSENVGLEKVGHGHVVTDLEYGTGSLVGGLDPMAASIIGSAASNKTFALPPEAIKIEYSNDSGKTWTDYGASDEAKFGLFAELRTSFFYLGKRTGAIENGPENAQTTDSMLRITIEPLDRYCSLQAMYCWFSSGGNPRCEAMIERSTMGAKTTFGVVKNWTRVAGDIANNIMYFSFGLFGGYPGQNSNNYAYRVTFRNVEMSATNGRAHVSDIRFLGRDVWIAPNNMVSGNRLYTWGENLTAYFEKSVSGDQLISRVATGTAPLQVVSKTMVPNLNADLLDGKEATDFAEAGHSHTLGDLGGDLDCGMF